VTWWRVGRGGGGGWGGGGGGGGGGGVFWGGRGEGARDGRRNLNPPTSREKKNATPKRRFECNERVQREMNQRALTKDRGDDAESLPLE